MLPRFWNVRSVTFELLEFAMTLASLVTWMDPMPSKLLYPSVYRLISLSRRSKRAVMLCADLMAVPLMIWLAFALRFNSYAPDIQDKWVFWAAPGVLIPALYLAGFYKSIVRYLGAEVAWSMMLGVMSSVVILAAASYMLPDVAVPRSVFLIWGMLSLLYLGGSRFLMRRFLGFLVERKDYVSLILAVIISITLLSSDESEEIRIIRGKTNDVLNVLYSPVQWVRDINILKRENEILKATAVQLKLLNSSLLNSKYENERLREMLEFKRERRLELIPGRVMSKGLSPVLNSITIDIGVREGIEENSAVMGIDGIVGKIVNVGERSSIVQILHDYSARVSVKLETSGGTGILRWRDDDTFEVWEIPKAIPIQMGERILTSGHSDIYPENLPVGTVTGVINRPEMLHKIIKAEAFTDFSSIQYVFVVRNLSSE